MKVKKLLKRGVAALFLAAAVFAFVSPAPRMAGVPDVQAVPLVLKFAWAGALAVVGFTLLFGRSYCEMMCPLGILQGFVNWLFHPRRHVRRVCTRLPVSRAQLVCRLVVLVAFVSLSALGFASLAGFVEPYALFGRAMTLFAPGLAVVGLVLVLAACGQGRFWCNWICPLGTCFTFLSRFAWRRHAMGDGGCAHCLACMKGTTTRDGVVCSAGASAEPETPEVTRRETLAGFAAFAAAEVARKTTDGGLADVTAPTPPVRERAVLPPGALPRDRFDRVCIGCGLCVKACPEKVLRPSTKLATLGQPELDFRHGFCRLACSYKCGHVCPTGAVAWLPRVLRRDVHMGRAVWTQTSCLRGTNGDPCTACVRKCPVKAIHVEGGGLVVDERVCIGCGACEHVCPARPSPAIRVEGYAVPRIVRPMASADLRAELVRLVDEGHAAAVARDGRVVAVLEGHGLAPIEEAERKDPRIFAAADVADRVVGLAAARIYLKGGARWVYGRVMSEQGRKALSDAGIMAEFGTTVPMLDCEREGR